METCWSARCGRLMAPPSRAEDDLDYLQIWRIPIALNFPEIVGCHQYSCDGRGLPGQTKGLIGDHGQLVTMRATAGKGEVEASGSLERHDLNRLALHRLEGGKTPFARRTRKLEAS